MAREGVGLVAGSLVTASVSSIATPVVGVPLGIVAGGIASKLVDGVWEPLQEFGKAAADGGFKAARLGR